MTPERENPTHRPPPASRTRNRSHVSVNLGLVPVEAHRLAKIRAAELGITLKDYLIGLVYVDVGMQSDPTGDQDDG